MSNPNTSSFRIWAGILLLILGLMTLFEGLSALIPSWVFSWSAFLLIAGALIIVRRGLSSPFGPILFCIGLFNIIEDIAYPYGSQPTLAGVLIGTAVYLIAGRKKPERISPPWGGTQPFDGSAFKKKTAEPTGFVANDETTKRQPAAENDIEVPFVDISEENPADSMPDEQQSMDEEPTKPQEDAPEYINITNVLGGSKKRVESANFKGGESLSFMGGCEIDLSQADIQGRVILDITQILGGTKLIVPGHWEIVSEMTSILGGIDDKRILTPHLKTGQKTLVLKGISLLGGIDIRTY